VKGLFSFLAFTPKKKEKEEGRHPKSPVCNWETSEALFWGEGEGR